MTLSPEALRAVVRIRMENAETALEDARKATRRNCRCFRVVTCERGWMIGDSLIRTESPQAVARRARIIQSRSTQVFLNDEPRTNTRSARSVSVA